MIAQRCAPRSLLLRRNRSGSLGNGRFRSVFLVNAELDTGRKTGRQDVTIAKHEVTVSECDELRIGKERAGFVDDPVDDCQNASFFTPEYKEGAGRLVLYESRLRKENRELRMERELLKKAAVFFAKQSE